LALRGPAPRCLLQLDLASAAHRELLRLLQQVLVRIVASIVLSTTPIDWVAARERQVRVVNGAARPAR
jgi:hypothetical protein